MTVLFLTKISRSTIFQTSTSQSISMETKRPSMIREGKRPSHLDCLLLLTYLCPPRSHASVILWVLHPQIFLSAFAWSTWSAPFLRLRLRLQQRNFVIFTVVSWRRSIAAAQGPVGWLEVLITLLVFHIQNRLADLDSSLSTELVQGLRFGPL
jgi:hypothetical protein